MLVLDDPKALKAPGVLCEPQIIALSPQAFTLAGYSASAISATHKVG